MSNTQIITKQKKQNRKVKCIIEFDIIDPEFCFSDDVWFIIKNFVGFFAKPQIKPRWTASSVLCLEIHWNCRQCNKFIKTQHNPNTKKVRQLQNEITLDRQCLKCESLEAKDEEQFLIKSVQSLESEKQMLTKEFKPFSNKTDKYLFDVDGFLEDGENDEVIKQKFIWFGGMSMVWYEFEEKIYREKDFKLSEIKRELKKNYNILDNINAKYFRERYFDLEQFQEGRIVQRKPGSSVYNYRIRRATKTYIEVFNMSSGSIIKFTKPCDLTRFKY